MGRLVPAAPGHNKKQILAGRHNKDHCVATDHCLVTAWSAGTGGILRQFIN